MWCEAESLVPQVACELERVEDTGDLVPFEPRVAEHDVGVGRDHERRVGHDQIEPLTCDGLEQASVAQLDVRDVIQLEIQACSPERALGDIRRHDLVRVPCHEHRLRTAAGPEIECTTHRTAWCKRGKCSCRVADAGDVIRLHLRIAVVCEGTALQLVDGKRRRELVCALEQPQCQRSVDIERLSGNRASDGLAHQEQPGERAEWCPVESARVRPRRAGVDRLVNTKRPRQRLLCVAGAGESVANLQLASRPRLDEGSTDSFETANLLTASFEIANLLTELPLNVAPFWIAAPLNTASLLTAAPLFAASILCTACFEAAAACPGEVAAAAWPAPAPAISAAAG